MNEPRRHLNDTVIEGGYKISKYAGAYCKMLDKFGVCAVGKVDFNLFTNYMFYSGIEVKYNTTKTLVYLSTLDSKVAGILAGDTQYLKDHLNKLLGYEERQ